MISLYTTTSTATIADINMYGLLQHGAESWFVHATFKLVKVSYFISLH